MGIFVAQASQGSNAMQFGVKAAGVEIAFNARGQPTHGDTYPLHGPARTEDEIDAALARLTADLQSAAAAAKQLLSVQKR
jgi:hypothetical protein